MSTTARPVKSCEIPRPLTGPPRPTHGAPRAQVRVPWEAAHGQGRAPSSGGGRPSKRTPQVKARVIAGLKAGLTLRLAAERTSITTVTLHS